MSKAKPIKMANVTVNPDTRFVKVKLKQIAENNGYCVGCPKVEEWRCPCKSFKDLREGWCGEGLYYKSANNEEK